MAAPSGVGLRVHCSYALRRLRRKRGCDGSSAGRWVAHASGKTWAYDGQWSSTSLSHNVVAKTEFDGRLNNQFLLSGSPRGPTELSASSVTVPAGTFQTVRAQVDFQQDWELFETDYIFEEPEVFVESEPNDEGTESAAQAIAPSAIAAGRADIGDPGTIVDDENVHANILGDKLLQDWYRLETTATGPFRLDLVHDRFSDGDFDVYLFREEAGGALTYVAASFWREWWNKTIVVPSLPASTYYVAIQAWDTPAGEVDYWFVIR